MHHLWSYLVFSILSCGVSVFDMYAIVFCSGFFLS
jgi:hypothetical protein